MHPLPLYHPGLRWLASVMGALLIGAAPASVLAIGLGPAPGAVPIGQPLDFNIAVRLDGEEALAPECVQAEVLVGERVLPSQVRVRATSAGSALIRVSTSAAVEEPVVSITVLAGCASRVTRRYVVFADPVNSAALAASPTAFAAAAPTGPLPGALPAASLPPADVVTTTPAPSPRDVAPSRREERAARAERSTRRARADGTERAEARGNRGQAAPATERRERAARPPRATRTAAAERASRTPAARAEPRSRLSLDSPEPQDLAGARPPGAAVEEALAAVALAASQARAAADAASASARRTAELEKSLEAARSEARAQRAEADRLRAQTLQSQELPWWSYALFGLSVLLALVAAWMAWRIRAMQQVQEAAWARATALRAEPAAAAAAFPAAADSASRETSPLPLITSEMTQPASLSRPELRQMPPPGPARVPAPTVRHPASLPTPTRPAAPPPMPDLDDLPSAVERTQVIPPTVRVAPRDDDSSPRDVSIEELIDVDQQAEFFIAIGQDQAAVDLLVSHLRATGGGSPLTYLKLLDIYRRLGEQEDYERTRSRFNHRFNAYAPEWGADLQAGRSLEAYDDVVPRLQAAWARPLDAMAELEALLFRKSRGELFDLPAYRDVLFLYSLARDLLERESPEASSDLGNVDLLLPLNPEADSRTPLRVGDARATADVPMDAQPTAPLDLDLTPIAPAPLPSIFSEPPARR